jgi:hypothetical protein
MAKSKKRPAVTKSERTHQKPRKNLVVSAIIVDAPANPLYVSFRNLLEYSLECLQSLPTHSEQDAVYISHYSQCIKHLNHLLDTEEEHLPERIRNQVGKFITEGNEVDEFLHALINGRAAGSDPNAVLIAPAAEIYLAGKASSLKWRVTCLLEEIKKPAEIPAS